MKGILHKLSIIALFLAYFLAVILKSDDWGNILSPVVTGIASYYVYQGYVRKNKQGILKIAGVFFFCKRCGLGVLRLGMGIYCNDFAW